MNTMEPEKISEEVNNEDPRQKLTWDGYIKPKSPTFANASGSALAAGYTESYAKKIAQMPWFKAKERRMNMLPKAEKVLSNALEMKTTDDKGNEKADLVRVATDVAKFIAKTIGKDEGYSERTEITGKGGSPIVFMPVELIEKYKLTNGENQMTDIATQ